MCAVQVRSSSVYTEVLEAAHPLHRGPTDHKRSVGPLLSLPEVHDQLFSFAHIRDHIIILRDASPCRMLKVSVQFLQNNDCFQTGF